MVFLRQRIYRMPSSQCRIIMPRPIVIPIQPLLRIKFFAIILVRLCISCICKYTAKRVIMICLLHVTILIYNYPVISLMIFQIIVVFIIIQRYVSFFRQ